jgi:Domain of unknown function (DUF4416)
MQTVEVQPVKLIIGFLYCERNAYRLALEQVRAVWGESDYQSQEYFFDLTDYYESEMGKPIFRSFNSYSRLIDPGKLAETKLMTNKLEDELGEAGKRRVNLDPGYLDYDKLVLASAKYNYQKVYLHDGIYADITMFYRKGRYIAADWAFPDFKDGLYENDFLQMRHQYKQQVKELLKSRVSVEK